MSEKVATGEHKKRYSFNDSMVAWDFMRACGTVGALAGYPTLRKPYTVEVLMWDMGKIDTLYDGFSH